MSLKQKFNRTRRHIRRHVWILTVIGFVCMSPVYWAKATQFVHYLVGFF
ncbi:hypothetical protein [Pseudomonas lurida]|nr:hypothetical protein [Pseudomonas lurida]MBD8671583.1 hypothetical protein [Pseudomonas lurida]